MKRVVADLDNDWVLAGTDVERAVTEIEGKAQ